MWSALLSWFFPVFLSVGGTYIFGFFALIALTDPWTGYRMYSADQIPTLNKIIYLRDSGFQISEIAAALAAENETSLLEQLDRKYREIRETIQSEQDKLQKIELIKKDILHGKNEMQYQVFIKSIPACQVLSLRRVLPDYYAEGLLWKEMSRFAQENRIQVSSNTFSIYHDREYKETDVDVEICAPVKKPGKSTEDFVFRLTEPVPSMARPLWRTPSMASPTRWWASSAAMRTASTSARPSCCP